MGVEEFGLGLAAVGSLSVPPAGSAAVDHIPAGASDGDVCAGD